ncbi:hypothetical protein [uncultured Thiohalocapsa sp.]|uniref:hypothetical protein n=1 Tax=uncultured Thiohalocapsa sp. TaxID=768990 RepID=UPI0025EBE561|nr:hypothetical protein [uncultured Thiohalocapsa sp.]
MSNIDDLTNGGIAVGDGMLNGDIRAFAMMPRSVPEPGTPALMALAAVLACRVAAGRSAGRRRMPG